jgi:hypothetical protein
VRATASILALSLPLAAAAQPLPDAGAVVAAALAQFEDRCGLATSRPAEYVASLAQLPQGHLQQATNSPDGSALDVAILRGGALEQVRMFAMPGRLVVICSVQGRNLLQLQPIAGDPAALDRYARQVDAALDATLAARPGVTRVRAEFPASAFTAGLGETIGMTHIHYGIDMPIGGRRAFVLAEIEGGVFYFGTHGEVPAR